VAHLVRDLAARAAGGAAAVTRAARLQLRAHAGPGAAAATSALGSVVRVPSQARAAAWLRGLILGLPRRRRLRRRRLQRRRALLPVQRLQRRRHLSAVQADRDFSAAVFHASLCALGSLCARHRRDLHARQQVALRGAQRTHSREPAHHSRSPAQESAQPRERGTSQNLAAASAPC
jgi:hypothetical protein